MFLWEWCISGFSGALQKFIWAQCRRGGFSQTPETLSARQFKRFRSFLFGLLLFPRAGWQQGSGSESGGTKDGVGWRTVVQSSLRVGRLLCQCLPSDLPPPPQNLSLLSFQMHSLLTLSLVHWNLMLVTGFFLFPFIPEIFKSVAVVLILLLCNY